MIKTLYDRRDIFLSRPEWRSTPWKSIEKAPYDAIVDVIYDVFAVLQKFDETCSKEDPLKRRDGLYEIITTCLDLENQLKRVYDKFDNSVPGPLYWPQLSKLESNLDDDISGKVFPISFYFSTFFVAQVVLGYWSAMTTVHHQLMCTYQKLAEIELPSTHGGSNDAARAIDVRFSIHLAADRADEHARLSEDMARNLCQSVEYSLQDRMGGLGPLAVLTHLSGCLDYLLNRQERFQREAKWMRETMGRIKHKMVLPQKNRFQC